VQVVAQVPRASARQSSAILSSIEFDRDAQLFATAGVSKRICVFDFANVMRNPLETQHRPYTELSTRSKLSCLSWNKYVRPHLISSDYEGAHLLHLHTRSMADQQTACLAVHCVLALRHTPRDWPMVQLCRTSANSKALRSAAALTPLRSCLPYSYPRSFFPTP